MPLQGVFLIPFLTKFQCQNKKNLLSQWGSFSLWKFLEQVARVGGNFFTFWCRKLGGTHCKIHWWYEENYTFNIIFKSWIIFTIAVSIKSYDICLTVAPPHSPCPTSHHVSQGFFGPGVLQCPRHNLFNYNQPQFWYKLIPKQWMLYYAANFLFKILNLSVYISVVKDLSHHTSEKVDKDDFSRQQYHSYYEFRIQLHVKCSWFQGISNNMDSLRIFFQGNKTMSQIRQLYQTCVKWL